MASITMKDLVKAYGDVEVLHHVEGDIEDGEVHCHRRAVGLWQIHPFCAWLRGWKPSRRVTSASATRLSTIWNLPTGDIAMVFQNYALYPHMSVRENMAYGLKIRKDRKGRDRPASTGSGRYS